LLIGAVVAGSPVSGTARRPQTVPSTEPAVATTEAPLASEAPAVTEVESTDAATEATEAASIPAEGHPVIGSWILVDVSDPESESAPFLAAFWSDGIFEQTDPGGASGYGAWEPTGPSSATLTFVTQLADEEGGDAGSLTVRAVGEVSPDGQTLTAEYTMEFVGEGAPPGEYGPGAVTGTRIRVEPMGAPAGSLNELFGGSEEGTETSGPPTTS
jgi:hypothetical protein